MEVQNEEETHVTAEDEVNKLISENEHLQKEIWNHSYLIRQKKERIEINNKYISQKCDHVLVRDREGCMYEKSTYKCTKCGLDPHYYRY